MLTISQLADYVGVTVRAIRHYHQRGLFPEPERDSSGYRRYDAHAVIELIRIKTLAEAGVPLARVAQLLAAGPEEFAAAVAGIDGDLEARIREMQEHRGRIAELASGERLLLPRQVVEFLDALRALGVSERTVEIERDGWIMLSARYGERILEYIEFKMAYLDNPDFVRFYRIYDESAGWDPDDPRIEEFAGEMLAYFDKEVQEEERDIPYAAQAGTDLDTELVSHLSNHSPAWRRLNEIAAKRAAERGRQSV
jgi:DNA-binding transcriptional MerR regulator